MVTPYSMTQWSRCPTAPPSAQGAELRQFKLQAELKVNLHDMLALYSNINMQQWYQILENNSYCT